MWYCPEKYKNDNAIDVNEEMKRLKGSLSDQEAKMSLIRFLHGNLGLTTELISGIKLAPYQEITLRGMMEKNFSMCVWGRGCGKTFIASVFCFLQCIFNPGTKILVAGPTFRTARFIFENLEKIVDSEGATLLMQCFGAKSKRNDQFQWQINEGTITAIPLNGEKIRGFRANVLLLDEFLLLPEETVKTVLMPFLVAPQNMKERIEVREMEDGLIDKGLMTEEDRMVFENDSKMIALSSASYTFENLYKTYKDWTNKIYDKEERVDSSYFVSQMGYESLPEHMIDHSIIEAAQDGGSSNASFQREYCAQFTDGSDSYFSARKMHECTIPDGEFPAVEVVGNPSDEYLLSFDPNWAGNTNADHFAMHVFKIDRDAQKVCLVHSYAIAGVSLKEHMRYFLYLIEHFNIIGMCGDYNGGVQFINSCNESQLFKDAKIEIGVLDIDLEKPENWHSDIMQFKNEYNVRERKYCILRKPTSNWIRNANEMLQAAIDHRRILFASRAVEGHFDEQRKKNLPVDKLKWDIKMNASSKGAMMIDLIDHQKSIVELTKAECANIEVIANPQGSQSFNLPQNLRRQKGPHRARKDSYSALVLGNWFAKVFFDAEGATAEKGVESTFIPFTI